MNCLVYFTILHGFADSGYGLLAEPIVGIPGVGSSYFVSKLLGGVIKIVKVDLFVH